MAEPHSRAWYEEIAKTNGGYFYPWRQELEGKSGESLFDELLGELLQPEFDVLEAGCGHGLDAARFGPKVARAHGCCASIQEMRAQWSVYISDAQQLVLSPKPNTMSR